MSAPWVRVLTRQDIIINLNQSIEHTHGNQPWINYQIHGYLLNARFVQLHPRTHFVGPWQATITLDMVWSWVAQFGPFLQSFYASLCVYKNNINSYVNVWCVTNFENYNKCYVKKLICVHNQRAGQYESIFGKLLNRFFLVLGQYYVLLPVSYVSNPPHACTDIMLLYCIVSIYLISLFKQCHLIAVFYTFRGKQTMKLFLFAFI